MICGSGGSKSRLAKEAGAEPSGQMRDEKLHAVVARSKFPNQNVRNTPFSDHFWKLTCQKSARRCGAKHIFSSQRCKLNDGYGALLDVQMSLRVAGAADCARCQKWAKNAGFVAISTTTTTTLHSTPLHSTPAPAPAPATATATATATLHYTNYISLH